MKLNQDEEPKRVRVYEVTPEFYLHELGGDLRAPCRIEGRIPDDAHVVRCHYDSWRNVLSLLVEHESFEEVPEGNVVPVGNPVVFHRLTPEEYAKAYEEKWGK